MKIYNHSNKDTFFNKFKKRERDTLLKKNKTHVKFAKIEKKETR